MVRSQYFFVDAQGALEKLARPRKIPLAVECVGKPMEDFLSKHIRRTKGLFPQSQSALEQRYGLIIRFERPHPVRGEPVQQTGDLRFQSVRRRRQALNQRKNERIKSA